MSVETGGEGPRSGSSGTAEGAAAGSPLAWVWAHPLALLELLFGLSLLALVLFGAEGGSLLELPLRIIVPIVGRGMQSLASLLRVDGAATLATLAILLARLLIAFLPAILLAWVSPWYRRMWLVPSLGLLFLFILLPVLSACPTPRSWLVLILCSAAAAWLSRFRWLFWVAVLPVALLLENVPRHLTGLNPIAPARRQQLYAACLRRDGVVPANLSPDKLMAYHGITALDDDRALLTSKGERDYMTGEQDRLAAPSGPNDPPASWWLRRRDGRYEFEKPSEVWGNVWRGCLLDGTIWQSRANWLIGVKRLPEGSDPYEELFSVRIPADEFDFGETACDPVRNRLFVAEATRGGIWEVNPETKEIRRHQIDGRIMLPMRRFDGKIMVSSSDSLREFDPDRGIVSRLPTALVGSGFDLCRVDGALAAADVVGRLRVFELDAQGDYHFAWGRSFYAPRRVAFSRDCSRLAVTSGDDEHVYILDRASHEILEVHEAGPALREVAATGPREFSITDICGVTSYTW